MTQNNYKQIITETGDINSNHTLILYWCSSSHFLLWIYFVNKLLNVPCHYQDLATILDFFWENCYCKFLNLKYCNLKIQIILLHILWLVGSRIYLCDIFSNSSLIISSTFRIHCFLNPCMILFLTFFVRLTDLLCMVFTISSLKLLVSTWIRLCCLQQS